MWLVVWTVYSDPTLRESFLSIKVQPITDTALYQVIQIGLRLSRNVNVFRKNEEIWLFRSIQLFSEHNVVAITSSPDTLQKSSLTSVASRSAPEKSATEPSSCRDLPLADCKRSPLASANVEGSPPRRICRPSGGVRFDVVRDLLVSMKHQRKEIWMHPAIYWFQLVRTWIFWREPLTQPSARSRATPRWLSLLSNFLQNSAYPMNFPGILYQIDEDDLCNFIRWPSVCQFVLYVSQIPETVHCFPPPLFCTTWLKQKCRGTFFDPANCVFDFSMGFWSVWGWLVVMPTQVFTSTNKYPVSDLAARTSAISSSLLEHF